MLFRYVNAVCVMTQVLELVEKMRSKIPNVLFSTDIIVGFPEETEEDFEDTLDVVRKVNFENKAT